MNYYKFILIFNVLYLVKHIYKYTTNKQYLRVVNKPDICNYKDDLIKLSTVVFNDILDNFINNEEDILEYKFNIICYDYDNYLCNEYNMLKYNMSLENVENNIINFLYNIFNDISIYKKNNEFKKCCNTYKLTWIN